MPTVPKVPGVPKVLRTVQDRARLRGALPGGTLGPLGTQGTLGCLSFVRNTCIILVCRPPRGGGSDRSRLGNRMLTYVPAVKTLSLIHI